MKRARFTLLVVWPWLLSVQQMLKTPSRRPLPQQLPARNLLRIP